MKRNLFGITAIVLAFSLAAFTPNKEQNIRLTTDYFWYPVDASTNLTNGTRLNSTKISKPAMITQYGFCLDTDAPVCLYGSLNSALTVGTTVPTSNNDVLIRETYEP